MKETFTVDYQGVRFFVADDTESALEILAAAGRPLPPIPKGVNTYLKIFTTAEGKAFPRILVGKTIAGSVLPARFE